MTARHLLDGVMQATGARNQYDLAKITGLHSSTLSRMRADGYTGMNLETFDLFQQVTGLPADTLLAWHRLPKGATLGRVVHRLRDR